MQIILRILCGQVERSTNRIATKKRSLGTAQHFDTLHVR